ncbi:hypothetical protein ACHAWX_006721, partial [Stephanocyclus meneghinianus]
YRTASDLGHHRHHKDIISSDINPSSPAINQRTRILIWYCTMATNEAIHPGEVECGSSLAEVAWTACIPSSDAASPPTNGPSSTEDVHSQIRRLRSLLARDVIIDPPPNATSSIDPLHFPTFLSPLQLPTSTPKRHTGTPVPLIYCDHTASHRPLASIENYLRTTSLPCHANTHTNTTYTASQSTAFVAEARQILAEAAGARVSGKAALDCVLFGGNGVTGAVSILIDALNLQSRHEKRPIVFVGPHEHHSNLIPWREAGCEVVNVPQSARGEVDLRALERMLQSKTYGVGSGRLRMGAFSAVSNVTGLIADVDAIAILLHRYHCLAFFDYASAAPYLKMNMNPTVVTAAAIDGSENGDNPSKDAMYFSPHKCYGGTSTPGVLIVKKRLLSQTNPPNISGGGTVFYVTNESHRFLSNRIERYEGGTPDGIGIQRAGLAMLAGRRVASEYERIVESAQCQENNAVTPAASNHVPKTLLEYECWTHDRVVKILKKKAPNLIMLGCDDPPTSQSASNPSCVGRHLPIFSFLIRCGRRFLHYNYVCAILNDVFGIQSRGGCQCAGPYSQRLLGLTKTVTRENESTNEEFLVEVPNNANRKIEQALLRSDRPCELLRPGYTRLSLPFKGLREEEVDYVIQALIWTAKNAWALLPQYTCDHRTGEWRHWSRRGKPLGSERRWLSHYDILSPKHTTTVSNSTHGIDDIEASQARLDLAMRNADALLEAAKNDTRFLSEVEKMNLADGMLGSGKDSGVGGIDDTLDELRWYVYQQECVDALREGSEELPFTMDKDALLGGVLREHVDDEESGEMELMPETSSSDMQQQQEHRQSSALQSSLPSLLSFQDGDHMGEASYEEIKSGFDDGELSSECLIFHHDIDEWIPIVDFIKHYEGDLPLQSANGRKRDLSAMKEVAEVESMECEETPSCNGINSMKINPVFQEPGPTLTSLTSAAEKREKKKPSRKNSQWGQCSAPHIIDPTEQDNATGNEKKSDFPDSSMPHASSNGITCKQNKKNKQIKPPPKMMRFITQAMIQWDMIQEGDRLLLGLSGGKDSLSLLHCLLEFQRKLPIKFDIEVCTIDPMTPSFDPSPLIPYVESLGLKYHYIRDDSEFSYL